MNSLLFFSALLLLALIPEGFTIERQFNGYSVLRIKPETTEQLRFMKELSEKRTDVSLHFFNEKIKYKF